MRVVIEETQALIIDLQEKLISHMYENESLLFRNEILIKGLNLLNVPITVSEQYPRGLGKTVFDLAKLTEGSPKFEKSSFSCIDNVTIKEHIDSIQKKFVIISGIEAHVCVLQTVLDCLEIGQIPVVVEDCISSRKNSDKTVALQRMRTSGAIITTYESLLFELCRDSKNEQFKEISQLVK